MATIVTLLTDFGLDDAFVGIMKGVILGIAPEARLVDLGHAIAPGDRRAAAFQLRGALPFFPAGTIHVVVVDPGVGTDRRILAVRYKGSILLAPDNGLLTPLFAASDEVRSVENTAWMRAEISRTFHGRDVFAPVAGHLASGQGFREVGQRVLPYADAALWPLPARERLRLLGCVLHVDHFGNLITNLEAEQLPPEGAGEVFVGGASVGPRRARYADVPSGEAVALLGSFGFLEIAVRDGNAARRFAAVAGTAVAVQTPE